MVILSKLCSADKKFEVIAASKPSACKVHHNKVKILSNSVHFAPSISVKAFLTIYDKRTRFSVFFTHRIGKYVYLNIVE